MSRLGSGCGVTFLAVCNVIACVDYDMGLRYTLLPQTDLCDIMMTMDLGREENPAAATSSKSVEQSRRKNCKGKPTTPSRMTHTGRKKRSM